MFGWARKTENLLAEYKAIISDQRDQIQDLGKQNRTLTDCVIALKAPAVLREVRRTPSVPPPPAQVSGSKEATKRRMHWPGSMPNLRPPSPNSPPALAPAMSDAEMVAARVKAGEPDVS